MLTGLIRTLRPQQWVKNLFVLAPLVFAQKLTAATQLKQGLFALLAFCCASSAVYIYNDYRDRIEDRSHPLKRNRPIASGQLPVPLALLALISMVLAAMCIPLVIYIRTQRKAARNIAICTIAVVAAGQVFYWVYVHLFDLTWR